MMRLRARALVALVFVALLASSPMAGAQGVEQPPGVSELRIGRAEVPRAEDFETGRTLGTALGLRAGVTGTSAVLMNPANLTLGRLYHAEAITQYVPRDSLVSFGSVIADSSTSRVRAGFASRGILGNDDKDYRGHDSRLALGMGLGDSVSIGLSLRYMRLRTRDRTLDGYPLSPELRAFTMDAALRVTPFEGFHIAALGYNLIRTHSLLAPTQLGGSIAYQYENVLQVGGDFLVDLTTFDKPTLLYGAGLEWVAGERYPIRAGFRRDEGRKVNAITSSFGFVDARYAIELAWRQEIGPYRETVVLLSARYVLDVSSQ